MVVKWIPFVKLVYENGKHLFILKKVPEIEI